MSWGEDISGIEAGELKLSQTLSEGRSETNNNSRVLFDFGPSLKPTRGYQFSPLFLVSWPFTLGATIPIYNITPRKSWICMRCLFGKARPQRLPPLSHLTSSLYSSFPHPPLLPALTSS